MAGASPHSPHFSSLRARGRRSLLCPGDHVSRRKPSPWAEPSRKLTGLLERRGLPGKRFWKEESLLFRENLSGSSEITEQRESRSSWSPGCERQAESLDTEAHSKWLLLRTEWLSYVIIILQRICFSPFGNNHLFLLFPFPPTPSNRTWPTNTDP